MALEDQLEKLNVLSLAESSAPSSMSSVSSSSSTNNGGALVYQRGVPVHAQQLFMSAVVTALKQVSHRTCQP